MPWGYADGDGVPSLRQMMKSSKEEMIEILDRKTKTLLRVIDHLSGEIEKLKQAKDEEMSAKKPVK
jgi:prefoldin subunit 5